MKAGLFRDHTKAGLYYLPATRYGDLPRLAAKAHLSLLVTNVGACQDSHETLRELGRAFDLPSWFGVNFDALYDCLTDPAWQPAKGLILQIFGLEALQRSNPDAFVTLIEVLNSAATTRSTGKYPLWILLTTPATGIPDLPHA